MSRPEVLFPLFADLTNLAGIGPKTATNLAQIDIAKPRDLLFTLPHAVIDRRRRDSVLGLNYPDTATVQVLVGRHTPPRQKGRPYRITVEDAETAFQLVFFHANPEYLHRMLPEGERRVVSGKVELFDGIPQMVHPEHMVKADQAESIPAYEPVYPLTHGVTQKQMVKAAVAAQERLPDLDEWIDAALFAQEEWPAWANAIRAAHAPERAAEITAEAPARRRLAYDEFFAHQLTLALARQAMRRGKGRPTKGDGALRAKLLASLAYTPTAAQTRANAEIAADMASDARMSRLLQGDVGSGKTLVAALALITAVEAGGQGVMMAPTEILARQHLASLGPLCAAAGVRVEVLTGRDKGAGRAVKLKDLAKGKIDILLGTHAVFQPDVAFADLRVAVVDEQHRFGVRQRLELGEKGQRADVLVMTATPIPRSLELAQYGDLDVSVLDEKPPGRQPVTTALISMGRIDEVVERLRSAVEHGQRAYWVCPLVDESETLDLTAAQKRFESLRARLGEGVVGLVHGQMPDGDRDKAMADFVAGRVPVLVATTVIEVGVDVPQATIMVIERAEHFGLAQLHQLRGRVGRGADASTCLLLYQPPLSQGGERRLSILRETEDGFRIAETDLAMRGAGDLIGTAQSGVPRFRIADTERQTALMATALSDARALLIKDPDLTSDRGKAVRVLLWLMEQDRAIRLISVG